MVTIQNISNPKIQRTLSEEDARRVMNQFRGKYRVIKGKVQEEPKAPIKKPLEVIEAENKTAEKEQPKQARKKHFEKK